MEELEKDIVKILEEFRQKDNYFGNMVNMSEGYAKRIISKIKEKFEIITILKSKD